MAQPDLIKVDYAMAQPDLIHLQVLVFSELGETMLALANDLSHCSRIFTFHGHDLQYQADGIHNESVRELLTLKKSIQSELAGTLLRENARRQAQFASEVVSTTEVIRHHLAKIVAILSEHRNAVKEPVPPPSSTSRPRLLATAQIQPTS